MPLGKRLVATDRQGNTPAHELALRWTDSNITDLILGQASPGRLEIENNASQTIMEVLLANPDIG